MSGQRGAGTPNERGPRGRQGAADVLAIAIVIVIPILIIAGVALKNALSW